MRSLLLLFLLIPSIGVVLAQEHTDSLSAVWENTALPDSSRFNALEELAMAYRNSMPDTSLFLAQMLYDHAKVSGSASFMAQAKLIRAGAYVVKGKVDVGLIEAEAALELFQKSKDKRGQALAHNLMGVSLLNATQYARSILNLQKTIEIGEEIGESLIQGYAMVNIAVIYMRVEEHQKAESYLLRALEIAEAQSVTVMRNSIYTNLAEIYFNTAQYEKSMTYYTRSIEVAQNDSNNYGLMIALTGLSKAFRYTGDQRSAQAKARKALEVAGRIDSKKGVTISAYAYGMSLVDVQRYVDAKDACQTALDAADAIEIPEDQRNACECLYLVHKGLGNSALALNYYERMNVFGDSLMKEEASRGLQRMELTQMALLDSIRAAEERRLINEAHEEELARKDRLRDIYLGSGVLALVFAGGFYSRWRYVRRSKKEIEREKERSESLLLNILPAEIAEELKEHGEAATRSFENVSVLFTDFKEFTQLSELLSAEELVSELNFFFKAFDGICEKYRIEKMKTLGDSYMATGGLPVPMHDSTKRLVLASLEMMDVVLERAANRISHGMNPFSMRAGIHTGPVVAGIVGVKKFQYDIWGDTVNTAARMESHGVAGKVNISQATYELIKDDPQFTFEYRGKVEAKGKGEVDMYFVQRTS